jgi:hypothetical protein
LGDRLVTRVRHASNSDQATLDPDSRVQLLQALLPEQPFHAGLALTYSADIAPLFAVLLVLSGSGASIEDVEAVETAHPSTILRAMQGLEDKMRIVMHSGRLRLLKTGGDAMASLLDRLVYELLPTHNGEPSNRTSFHPKLFLLEYKDNAASSAPSEIRLIVTSRNLTLDRCMDIVGVFRVVLTNAAGPSKDLEDLQVFLTSVMEHSPEPFPQKVQDLVSRIANGRLEPLDRKDTDGVRHVNLYAQVGRAEGAGSVGFEKLRERLAARSSAKRIVISPFVDYESINTFLCAANRTGTTSILLSTPTALDEICSTDQGVQLLKKTTCFVLRNLEEEGYAGLHAKLILDKRDNDTALVFGSANLTSRAWGGRNWECMLEAVAEQSIFTQVAADFFGLGIQASKRAPLAVPYVPELKPKPPISRQELWCDVLSLATLCADTSKPDQSGGLTVNVWILVRPPKGASLGEFQIGLRPISGNFVYWAKSANDRKFLVSWQTHVSDLTCFVEIVVKECGRDVTRLVRRLNIDVELLNQRDQKALARVFAEYGPLRYLADLFSGVGITGGRTSTGAGSEFSMNAFSGIGMANIEALYIACIEHPELLEELDRVLSLSENDFPSGAQGEAASKALGLLRPIWKMLKQQFFMA